MVLTKRSRPRKDSDSASDESTSHQTEEQLRQDSKKSKGEAKGLKHGEMSFLATRRFLFSLGILFGIMLGFSLIDRTDIEGMQAQLLLFMDEYDISLPALPDFDFSRVEAEWIRLRSNIPELWKFNRDGREFRVGEKMAERGLSAKYPVILVPGVISTGLESWSTTPDYRPFFREKLWGGFNMLSQVTFNREKWIAAMMLDPITGLDPPEAKIRAAQGIDAASNFIQGYWIWSKIVENLAVVNYDTNNLFLAPYDWRLSYYNLEERDGYFSRLKSVIENFKRKEKKKTVIAAHSMGATAKAMAAFLSGEMKDTVQMNPMGSYVLERFFSRVERRKLFLTWAGSASMWIKGGDAIWGNAHFAPDDQLHSIHSHGELIAFRESRMMSAGSDSVANMTSEQAGTWILQHTPATFQKMMATNYSVGIERDEANLKRNDGDHTKWSNPLEVRLPNAPSMKMYCVYGHGKETERSYWYARGAYEHDGNSIDGLNPTCSDAADDECVSERSPLNMPLTRKSWIDADYTNETVSPKVRNGVKMGEGDGTVSLLSLGAMCVEGWKRPRWNPAGIKVTTVELPHQPIPSIPRGGANTSDHVDILGSTGLNEIILKVVTGVGHEVEENFVSNIREYAQRIQWDLD
ncbi:LACT-domain-containing protein [Guyanagaster necrorhizus]|uniref:LACT-domain-containing protein n=1 Tax=Guyanagaster necrorhizus TaxID=856835 RepID=A0A9P7VXZ8_9AGAR|nr:LACT-domain-containing protein [Guyanagaster necrorhizus MCA 3950]KAG7449626.1 LACT-domain-containing protein [Guyanagaster necrorhizus MCA 3950]